MPTAPEEPPQAPQGSLLLPAAPEGPPLAPQGSPVGPPQAPQGSAGGLPAAPEQLPPAEEDAMATAQALANHAPADRPTMPEGDSNNLLTYRGVKVTLLSRRWRASIPKAMLPKLSPGQREIFRQFAGEQSKEEPSAVKKRAAFVALPDKVDMLLGNSQ